MPNPRKPSRPPGLLLLELNRNIGSIHRQGIDHTIHQLQVLSTDVLFECEWYNICQNWCGRADIIHWNYMVEPHKIRWSRILHDGWIQIVKARQSPWCRKQVTLFKCHSQRCQSGFKAGRSPIHQWINRQIRATDQIMCQPTERILMISLEAKQRKTYSLKE
jgi:hypothetical protein